jgi:hypothetical protein
MCGVWRSGVRVHSRSFDLRCFEWLLSKCATMNVLSSLMCCQGRILACVWEVCLMGFDWFVRALLAVAASNASTLFE